jgi:hypothetical protein
MACVRIGFLQYMEELTMMQKIRTEMYKQLQKSAQSVKNVMRVRPVARNIPYGKIFRDPRGAIMTLRSRDWRAERSKDVRFSDFVILPYYHPEERLTGDKKKKARRTAVRVARRILKSIKNNELDVLSVGIELEGNLYDKRLDKGTRLKPKYDGRHFTAKNDDHPEMFDSVIEVATDQLPDGRYPSNPVEVAQALAKAVQHGLDIAKIRHGVFVVASVPEGGDSSQIRLTKHPYLQLWKPPPVTELPFYSEIPKATKAVYKKAGIKDVIPFLATHVHIKNPVWEQGEGRALLESLSRDKRLKIAEEQFADPIVAHAKALLRTTQFEKTLNFILYSTRHYVGTDITVADVRALARRGYRGTHDYSIPSDVYEYFEESIRAVKKGEVHSPSRHKATAEHGVVRTKEFLTTEGVDGAGNGDLRLVLTKAFADQLREVLAYEALIAVDGDSSQVIPYLQLQYGRLFNQIPAIEGKNNSHEQDLAFNKKRFETKISGTTYRNQMLRIINIVKEIGERYPTLQIQARIVCHVLDRVSQKPDKSTLEEYLDWKTGIKTGIVTDHKSANNIEENVKVQAKALTEQTAALSKVTTEQELLEFFCLDKDMS